MYISGTLLLYWDLYILRQLQVTASCPITASCRIPLTISWRADLVITNSLSFLLSGNTLLPPCVLKASFAGYKIPEEVFFFFFFFSLLALNILAQCLWPLQFLIRNLLITLLWISCVGQVTYVLLFWKFFLSLTFDCLIIMCLGMVLFGFVLHHWVSLVFTFTSFMKVDKVLAIISSNIPSASFSPLLPGFPQCSCWSMWYGTDPLSSVHIFVMIFLCSSGSVISILIFKFTDYFFCLLKSAFEWLWIFNSFYYFSSKFSCWLLCRFSITC